MLLGIGLAAAANIAFITGYLIQQRAVRRIPMPHIRPVLLLRHAVTSPLWLLGLAIVVTAQTLQTIALVYVPVIVTQPITVSATLMLLPITVLCMDEQLVRREWVALGLLTVSLLLVLRSIDPKEETAQTNDRVLTMLAFVLIATIVGTALFITNDQAESHRHRLPITGVSYAIATGFLFGGPGLAAKALSGAIGDRRGWEGVQAAAQSPFLYLLVVTGLAGLATFQIALRCGRASIVIPVANGVASVFVGTLTGPVFGESYPFGTVGFVLRATGLALIVIALFIFPRQIRDEPIPRPARRKAAPLGEGP